MEHGGGARADDTVPALAFVGVSVLASGNAVAIRFSNRELDWLWGAALRFILAAVVLVFLVLLLKLPRPRGRELQGALIFGALGLAGAFTLTYWALQTIQAGLAQTLLSLVPLATLLLVGAARQERITGSALAGAIIATVGVSIMVLRPSGQVLPVLPILAMIGAVLCVAAATIAVRRSPTVHPLAMNCVAASTAAGLLLGGSLLVGQRPTLPDQPQTWVAVVYLALIGSVAVFTLQLLVLKYWSAARANFAFVLIPLLTIALSAWLDAEPVGLGLIVGGTFVVLGVYLGALRGQWRRSGPRAG